ncbi:hypothetical protein ACKKBG_A10825 [Auxenochlorella protothecoides x Auxenochlorella symbiontica]
MWPFRCCQVCSRAPPVTDEPAPAEKKQVPTTPPQSLELIRAHSRSGSRILQNADSGASRQRAGPSQSLLEASARRLASVTETDGNEAVVWDLDDQGIPQMFLDAYFDAIKQENSKWAIDNPAVADLFAEDAKMLTQDKQNLTGRPAILKQLEKGVGLLIKMGGKSGDVPEVTVEGPSRTPEGYHVMKCSMKRGLRTLSFTLEFHIKGGKIQYMQNTRS